LHGSYYPIHKIRDLFQKMHPEISARLVKKKVPTIATKEKGPQDLKKRYYVKKELFPEGITEEEIVKIFNKNGEESAKELASEKAPPKEEGKFNMDVFVKLPPGQKPDFSKTFISLKEQQNANENNVPAGPVLPDVNMEEKLDALLKDLPDEMIKKERGTKKKKPAKEEKKTEKGAEKVVRVKKHKRKEKAPKSEEELNSEHQYSIMQVLPKKTDDLQNQNAAPITTMQLPQKPATPPKKPATPPHAVFNISTISPEEKKSQQKPEELKIQCPQKESKPKTTEGTPAEKKVKRKYHKKKDPQSKDSKESKDESTENQKEPNVQKSEPQEQKSTQKKLVDFFIVSAKPDSKKTEKKQNNEESVKVSEKTS